MHRILHITEINFSMLQDFFQNCRVFEMGPVRAIQKTIYRNGKTMCDFSQWNVFKILQLDADAVRCSFRNGDTYPAVKCSSFWPKTTTRTAHFTSFGRKKKKTSHSFVNNIYNNTYKLTQTSKNSARLSIHYFDRKLFRSKHVMSAWVFVVSETAFIRLAYSGEIY